jgi:hypothetical protein
LGVFNGNLILGDHYDYVGHAYPIPQTMAGNKMKWTQRRSKNGIERLQRSQAQYQINAVINKYIEGGNRTNQKQSYFYGTERYRDLKIILQNRLARVTSSLRSQLSDEITKPTYNNATLLKHATTLIEMAYGLPYKHEDSTVAINLVDAQLEQDLSQSPFARDQDRFEMMLILNEECVEYSNGKLLDLEKLLSRIESIFKPIEEEVQKDPNVMNRSQTPGSLDSF